MIAWSCTNTCYAATVRSAFPCILICTLLSRKRKAGETDQSVQVNSLAPHFAFIAAPPDGFWPGAQIPEIGDLLLIRLQGTSPLGVRPILPFQEWIQAIVGHCESALR